MVGNKNSGRKSVTQIILFTKEGSRYIFNLSNYEKKILWKFYGSKDLSGACLDETLNFEIPPTTIYRTLRKLCKLGFIELKSKNAGITGRKNIYEITEKGIKVYEDLDTVGKNDE